MAYYLALNIAWAQSDLKHYDYFHEKLEVLYHELLEEYAPEDEAPKQEL